MCCAPSFNINIQTSTSAFLFNANLAHGRFSKHLISFWLLQSRSFPSGLSIQYLMHRHALLKRFHNQNCLFGVMAFDTNCNLCLVAFHVLQKLKEGESEAYDGPFKKTYQVPTLKTGQRLKFFLLFRGKVLIG